MSRARIDVDAGTLSGLVAEGKTAGEIAKALGASKNTVIRRMVELGIEPARQNGTGGNEPLPPIPERIGYEDRLKLEWIRAELDRGRRDPRDSAVLRERYRDILRHPNPDPPGLAARLWQLGQSRGGE